MIAEAVKHMMAAGMSNEAIVAAISDMEKTLVAVPDPVAERRRAYDRERKRAGRLSMSGGHPVESADTPSLDKEKSPIPPKEINLSPEREPRVRSDAGSHLPAGWKPARLTDGTVAGEIRDRRGRDWMKRSLESFDNHWRAKSGRDGKKRDWQATWANWVIEQDRRDDRSGGQHRNGSRAGGSVDPFTRVLNELAGDGEASNHDAGYG